MNKMDNSNPQQPVETVCYSIVPDYDLTIRVIERKEVSRFESDGSEVRRVKMLVTTKVHEFKVKRIVLSSNSVHFKTLLSSSQFKEAGSTVIDLYEDYPTAVAIWFRILHGCNFDDPNITGPPALIRDVWEMLVMADKYGLNLEARAAKSWFSTWYEASSRTHTSIQAHQMLLLPCHSFDYAAGFATASKFLAYNAIGHITERRPDMFNHEHLHLRSLIIRKCSNRNAENDHLS